MTILDWSAHIVGKPEPCHRCGRPALVRDITARPCHKTCAEAAVDRLLSLSDRKQARNP